MSAVHGHWFPLIDRSAPQRIGYEIQFAGGQAFRHTPPPALELIRRQDLLRGMMVRLLTLQGKETRTIGTALVILDAGPLPAEGRKVWAAPTTERRERIQQTMRDGSPGLSRDVLGRDRAEPPSAGIRRSAWPEWTRGRPCSISPTS